MWNEDLLKKKALQRPIFGWSSWGRTLVWDEENRRTATFDGLWIIALAESGLVGLTSVTLVLLLPGALLMRRSSAAAWLSPALAAAVALSLVVALHMLDNLFNAMANPIFMLAAGGTVGVASIANHSTPQTRSQTVRARSPSALIQGRAG